MFRRVAVRLIDAVRAGPVSSMVVVGLLGAVLAATAIAATTGASGGPITAVKLVRSTDHFGTSSTTYSDVPGASTTITVPSGQRAVIVARFSGTSDCPTLGSIGHCFARILIGGVEGAPETGTFGYFDSSQSAVVVGTSHYIERSRAGYGGLPAGSYQVKVQAKAGTGATLELEGWHLTVETSQVG
jgi:hypothetical protein